MEGRSDIKILYAFYIHICYSQMHRASTNQKNNCCATEPQKNYWRPKPVSNNFYSLLCRKQPNIHRLI